MSKAYTTEVYQQARDRFLALKDPGQLADLLKISLHELHSLASASHYHIMRMRNARGKVRVLFMPDHKLKAVQRRLNHWLQAVYYLEKPSCVYGFVRCPDDVAPKLDIITHAQNHVGRNFVVGADVFRFFPSIKAHMVRNVFLSAPFHFDPQLASALALLCVSRNWLPTGSPVSPVISNLVFLGPDRDLQLLADRYGYTYTRYADDLTFSGHSRPDEAFRHQLEEILLQHGFILHRRKYRVQSRTTRQMVTGLVVNDKVSLPREYRKRLRAIQHNLVQYGPELEAKTFFNRFHISENDLIRFQYIVRGRQRWVDRVRMTSLP
jgi:RNA-directed DNA polymerase